MVKKKILKADVYVVEAQVSFLFFAGFSSLSEKGQKNCSALWSDFS